MGVRKLGEVQRSFFMKFGWKILTQRSLWARFFRAKYVKNGHIVLSLECKPGLKFWRGIVEGLSDLLQNSKWKVREGKVSLWFDKFLNSGPLLEFQEFVINDQWDVERLQALLGEHLTSEVVSTVGVLREVKDVLIWLPDKNSIFSTKSAWKLIRVKMPNFTWAKWVWNSMLSKKISLCMWKAFFNCLSVDEQVRKLRILMVSCCNCCLEGQVEDLKHVLCKCEFAIEVWKKISGEVGVPFMPQQSWHERVHVWFNRASRHSQLGIMEETVCSKVGRKR